MFLLRSGAILVAASQQTFLSPAVALFRPAAEGPAPYDEILLPDGSSEQVDHHSLESSAADASPSAAEQNGLLRGGTSFLGTTREQAGLLLKRAKEQAGLLLKRAKDATWDGNGPIRIFRSGASHDVKCSLGL